MQVQGRREALAQGVGKRLPADQGAGCKVHSTSGVQLRLDFLLLLLKPLLLLLSLPLLLLREGRTRRVASQTRSLAGRGSGGMASPPPMRACFATGGILALGLSKSSA